MTYDICVRFIDFFNGFVTVLILYANVMVYSLHRQQSWSTYERHSDNKFPADGVENYSKYSFFNLE